MSVMERTYRSKDLGRKAENGMAGTRTHGQMDRQRTSTLKGEWPGRIRLTRVERNGSKSRKMGEGHRGCKKGREKGKYLPRYISQVRARESARAGLGSVVEEARTGYLELQPRFSV